VDQDQSLYHEVLRKKRRGPIALMVFGCLVLTVGIIWGAPYPMITGFMLLISGFWLYTHTEVTRLEEFDYMIEKDKKGSGSVKKVDDLFKRDP
jgi:hypothetical protein